MEDEVGYLRRDGNGLCVMESTWNGAERLGMLTKDLTEAEDSRWPALCWFQASQLLMIQLGILSICSCGQCTCCIFSHPIFRVHLADQGGQLQP